MHMLRKLADRMIDGGNRLIDVFYKRLLYKDSYLEGLSYFSKEQRDRVHIICEQDHALKELVTELGYMSLEKIDAHPVPKPVIGYSESLIFSERRSKEIKMAVEGKSRRRVAIDGVIGKINKLIERKGYEIDIIS
jgi:hypothetical protein